MGCGTTVPPSSDTDGQGDTDAPGFGATLDADGGGAGNTDGDSEADAAEPDAATEPDDAAGGTSDPADAAADTATDAPTSAGEDTPKPVDAGDPPIDLPPPGDGACAPDCNNRICGSDGCTGICGYCTYPEVCDGTGQCVEICVPDCEAKFCGGDGCGGTCGECEEPLACGTDGLCYAPDCVPNCVGKVCGPNGCGGDCGLCAEPKVCVNGGCALGPCGTVTSVGECQGEVLVFCVEQSQLIEQDCDQLPGHECTYDGFANKFVCAIASACEPQCEDKECGSDSCEGICGLCPDGWSCLSGTCQPEVGGDCSGDFSEFGTCIDNVLWFCSGAPPDDKLYSVDCSSIGGTCKYNQDTMKLDCL